MTEYRVRQGAGGAGSTLPTLAAAAAIARPGDVVIVEPGVYREALRPPQGTTWRGEPGAVIDGGWDGSETTEAEARANAVLIKAAGVTLEGIEIRNVKGNGVAVGEGGYDFTMRRCEIHHTANGGFGANPTGQTIRNLTIEDCYLHHLSLTGQWHETPVNGCCLFRYVKGLTVTGTRIRFGYGEGFALGPFTEDADINGLWVEDTAHLAVYASDRARNVRFRDCVVIQRGLPEWSQGDGDVGAGFVIGDEVSGDKTARWPHADNVVIENCLVVGTTGVEVRNQRKVAANGKPDGYDTRPESFAVRNCTFIGGPHAKGAVVVAENTWGGRVRGVLRGNLFITDRLPDGVTALRSNAPGVEFIDNLWSPRPPDGLPVTNQAVAATALVAPFATVGDVANLDNYRPRHDGPLAGAGYGALAAIEGPNPPEEPGPPVDLAALLRRVEGIALQQVAAYVTARAAVEQASIASLAAEGAARETELLLTELRDAANARQGE